MYSNNTYTCKSTEKDDKVIYLNLCDCFYSLLYMVDDLLKFIFKVYAYDIFCETSDKGDKKRILHVPSLVFSYCLPFNMHKIMEMMIIVIIIKPLFYHLYQNHGLQVNIYEFGNDNITKV